MYVQRCIHLRRIQESIELTYYIITMSMEDLEGDLFQKDVNDHRQTISDYGVNVHFQK